jgi:hypothetical protein
MSLPSFNIETPAHQNNVRLVAVDDHHQPAYLKRAAHLEQAVTRVAAQLGVQPDDMPGLRGLCVEAIRTAEVHGR